MNFPQKAQGSAMKHLMDKYTLEGTSTAPVLGEYLYEP